MPKPVSILGQFHLKIAKPHSSSLAHNHCIEWLSAVKGHSIYKVSSIIKKLILLTNYFDPWFFSFSCNSSTFSDLMYSMFSEEPVRISSYYHCRCRVWFLLLSISEDNNGLAKELQNSNVNWKHLFKTIPDYHSSCVPQFNRLRRWGSFRSMISVPFSIPVFHQLFHLWDIIILFYISGNYL